MNARELCSKTLCALALCLARTVFAADYFVAPAGSDQADGISPTAAWKSIDRVNSNSFHPGDRILFQGGASFRGNLRLGRESGALTNGPITITASGKGRATLLAGRETGIAIYSAGGVAISNLIVIGDGATNNTGYGILCDNRLDDFQCLANVRIENVEASGFGMFGVLVSGKKAGFDHVRVVGCDLHDNLRGGMEVAGRLGWESPLYALTDVIVSRSAFHDNTGDPNYDRNHSGSGMVLYQVDGGTVEDCRAWGNGRLCHHGNGGVGIWSCASRGVVIQHCESFSNRTSGGDGGGFDLDGGSIGCVLQYNYSHDNDGPGLMAYTYAYASYADSNNVIRFNISDQDAGRGDRYAGLWVRSDGNAMTGLKVYNNTVRMARGGRPAAYVDGKNVAAEFRNNIFMGSDAATPLVVEEPQDKLRFENNLYWSSGSPFRLQWGSQSFTSLEQWRAATGQEIVGGKSLGAFADPGFDAASLQSAGNDTSWQNRLTAYKPRRIAWPAIMREIDADPRMDILGSVLAVEKWPLGALAPGS